MGNEKNTSVTIRLNNVEKELLEKEAYNNGRTISGEIRFKLRKLREQENAKQETAN